MYDGEEKQRLSSERKRLKIEKAAFAERMCCTQVHVSCEIQCNTCENNGALKYAVQDVDRCVSLEAKH